VVKRLIILKNILDGYVGRKTGEDVKKTINIARLNNKQLYRALSLFDRKMIRKFAKTINIPVGDNKECTLYNLVVFGQKLKNFKIEINLINNN